MARVSTHLATTLTRSLHNRVTALLAVLSLVLMSGGLIMVSASGAGATGNGAETQCGTPGKDAYDDVVVDTPARPAYDDVVHHDAVPAVTRVVHHDAVQAVYVTEYQWSNPPGQGNDENPGNGGEPGAEEKWLPEGQSPNANANQNGRWVKTGQTRQTQVTAGTPAWDETVVVTPAQEAYDQTIHHDAVPAVTHTVHHDAVPAGPPCEDPVELCPDGSARAGEAVPCTVTPNLPSQTAPTCSLAGAITAPAAQTGVRVSRTELVDGKVQFVSTPASGYSFEGQAQSVSTTVQARPRLTGSACGDLLGDDATGGKPSVKPAAAKPAAAKPAAKVQGTADVLGDASPLPTAVDAGLSGQPQNGPRSVQALVGQALLGGGLLLLVVTGWSGLGRRRHGVPQV